ncbi:MAG: phosphotransferase family protein [Acidimicrobiia bacterium]
MSESSLIDGSLEGQVTRWIERDLGGTVTHIERQARWRPAWFVDLEQRNGHRLELYVRGDRTDSPSAFPLEHEYRYQTLLHDAGIPVAAVHGWCDEPKAYVMERVPGRFDFEGVPDDERRSVMEDYVDILARMHELDVEPFGRAGIVRATDPSGSATVGLHHFEQRAYRSLKSRPDPFLEFALGWCARNRPSTDGREAPVVWDAGQLLHRDGKVTAIIDLEFGHIGDPLMDLGGMWTRNPFLHFGDMEHLMRRYEQRRAMTVDMRTVQYHSILWHLSNPLEFHHTLAEPVLGSDYMLNRSWVLESNLIALEGIADMEGVPLADVEEPEARRSPFEAAHHHLAHSLEASTPEGGFGRYQLRMAVRLARHLERIEEIGAEVVLCDLDDARRLLGLTASTWEDGEVELERFVMSDNGRHDAQLIELFHRRLHRARMLNGPSGSWITQHREAPQPKWSRNAS